MADILLAGRHIHMARCDLPLAHGRHTNIFRGADGNMYARFSALGTASFADHVDFAPHLPKTRGRPFSRRGRHTIVHMTTDFHSGEHFADYVRFEVIEPRKRRLTLVRFQPVALPVAWPLARCEEPNQSEPPAGGQAAMAGYGANHTGTLARLWARHRATPDWSRLPRGAHPMIDAEPGAATSAAGGSPACGQRESQDNPADVVATMAYADESSVGASQGNRVDAYIGMI